MAHPRHRYRIMLLRRWLPEPQDAKRFILERDEPLNVADLGAALCPDDRRLGHEQIRPGDCIVVIGREELRRGEGPTYEDDPERAVKPMNPLQEALIYTPEQMAVLTDGYLQATIDDPALSEATKDMARAELASRREG